MDRKLSFLATFLILSACLYWAAHLLYNGQLGAQENLAQLEEAHAPEESAHESWWLYSGGRVTFENGIWQTIQGPLDPEDIWRKAYLRWNPMDTDNGYHPQNIFKLFSKDTYINPVQELRFEIVRDQLSMSPNRNETSGVFLYSRYLNIDNYYYAGVQMDGKAVIRKKSLGIFHTLAEAKVLDGEYDRDASPNLLPKNTETVLRTELTEESDGLEIKLYINNELVLEVRDPGLETGPFSGPDGLVGIRSDFMDVKFTSYNARDIVSDL